MPVQKNRRLSRFFHSPPNIPAMSLVVENPHANAATRERESLAAAASPRPRGKSLPKGKTALALSLSPSQTDWLAQYATDQWNAYHLALAGWRSKMKKYERIAEMDRSDRKGAPDHDRTSATKTIFDDSNRSLGLVSGFADFAFAQARDDLFGTAPWFAANPQGLADEALATAITRHAHWKFNQTSLKECFTDSLRIAVDTGTAFPKLTWRREIETYETIKKVAIGPDGTPALNPDGSYATLDDLGLPPDAPEVATQEMLVEEQATVYDNIEARCIDYQDIAFDPTAPELDLLYTDVFHRFQIGLLDAKQIYSLTDEQYRAALDLINAEKSGARTPRDHRDEASPTNQQSQEADANPPILLVEGYMRCNPKGASGTPIRIRCIFSPLLATIFTLDYLHNQTPGGMMPIYAIPWFKTPNRIIGKGYFERFEDVDDFIDEQFNLTVHRDRMAANPVGGFDIDAVDEDIEESDVTLSPGRLWKMKPGRKIEEFLTFMNVPDANQRTVELMNMMTQMGQMRTGITSASQGELAGVPESNTATGIRQIVSRGAILLKWPIDEVKNSLARPLDGAVKLLYANHDQDETFTWSEGNEPELMQLKREDVKGVTINVHLTMTQAQNQEKLQNGQAAIGFHQSYIQLPEPEKQAARPLYEQTIQALGFHGADQIIREPVTDAAGIAALLPLELQQPFLMFAQQMGLIAAPQDPATANPGESAGPPQESPPTA